MIVDQQDNAVASQVSVLGMFPTKGSEGEQAFVEVKNRMTCGI